jgi:hypothetical protein
MASQKLKGLDFISKAFTLRSEKFQPKALYCDKFWTSDIIGWLKTGDE